LLPQLYLKAWDLEAMVPMYGAAELLDFK